MAKVTVLLEGYSIDQPDGSVVCDSNVTLIQSSKNIIVDTANVGSEQKILNALEKAGVKPEEIDYVVHSHGHPDHIGCTYLFKNATIIGFGTLNKGEVFNFFEDTFKVDEDVEVKQLPGHTSLDVTTFVKTDEGVVAVTGDLFDNENDNPETNLAAGWSNDWEKQEQSRKYIWEHADFIIPGHGKKFSVHKPEHE